MNKDTKLIWEAYDDESPLDLKDTVKRFEYSKTEWMSLWERKTSTAKWGDVGVDTLDIEIDPRQDMDIDLHFSWLHSDQMIDIIYKIHGGDDMDEGGPDVNLDDQIYNYMKNNFIGAAHDILDDPIKGIFGVEPATGLAVDAAPWQETLKDKPKILLNDFGSDYVTIQISIPQGLQWLSTTRGWENVNQIVNDRFARMIMLRDAVLGPNTN